MELGELSLEDATHSSCFFGSISSILSSVRFWNHKYVVLYSIFVHEIKFHEQNFSRYDVLEDLRTFRSRETYRFRFVLSLGFN